MSESNYWTTVTERRHQDVMQLLARLGSEFATLESRDDIYQTTLRVSNDVLDADVSVIAEADNGGLAQLASSPREWTDTDGLLSPVSLPSVVATRGISYAVADRGDVRGATGTKPLPNQPAKQYRAVLIVPFGDEAVLIAGSEDAGAFTDWDLELLRLLGSFARNLYENVETTAGYPETQEWVAEAAAGLSHDAQNFFGIIEGRLALAREDPQPEHFDAIERATHRLSELVEDTKTLLETGTYAIEPEPVPLREVINEAWHVGGTENAELLTRPLPSVLADRSRLSQLLENLFRNAVEHAGPDVTVWVGMLPDSDGFYVEDDGPGIDPSERDSVLQFAYSTSNEHTGVGLNIVQRIAAAHGWDISITGGDLGGTRFAFEGVDIVE